jgi:hypothetical protein
LLLYALSSAYAIWPDETDHPGGNDDTDSLPGVQNRPKEKGIGTHGDEESKKAA